MFAAIQSALVGLVEDAREAARTEGVQSGRLAPLYTGPYQGELLSTPRLKELTPAVFIELDDGQLDALSLSRNTFSGKLPFDFICVVYNEAGTEAAYSDGMALLTWTFDVLRGGRLSVEDGAVEATYRLGWDAFRFRRVVSGQNLWAYALTPNIEFV